MKYEEIIEELAAKLKAAGALEKLERAGAKEWQADAALISAAEAVIRYRTEVNGQCRPGDEKKNLMRRLSGSRQSLEQIEKKIRRPTADEAAEHADYHDHGAAERAWLERAKISAAYRGDDPTDKDALRAVLKHMEETPSKPNDGALMSLLLALLDVFHDATGKHPGYARPFILAVAAASGIEQSIKQRRIRAAREMWEEIRATAGSLPR